MCHTIVSRLPHQERPRQSGAGFSWPPLRSVSHVHHGLCVHLTGCAVLFPDDGVFEQVATGQHEPCREQLGRRQDDSPVGFHDATYSAQSRSIGMGLSHFDFRTAYGRSQAIRSTD